MSIHRHAAKRDTAERPIIEALKQAGCEVLQLSGKGIGDLLVLKPDDTLIVLEIKTPKIGRLTAAQKAISPRWRKVMQIAKTPDDALKAVGSKHRLLPLGIVDDRLACPKCGKRDTSLTTPKANQYMCDSCGHIFAV